MRRKRILLTTFGSLGDLHPYMAIAAEWNRRGNEAVIATSEVYRQKVEAEGILFSAVRPDLPDPDEAHKVIEKIFDLRHGPEFMIREIVMPHLRQSYDDLTAASHRADLIVSHPLTFAATLVAQKQGIAWASSILAPLSLFSAYDPPVVASAPGFSRLRVLGPKFIRTTFRLIKRTLRTWTEPVRQLRRDVGLPASTSDPLFEGQFSPIRNLALFSPQLAAPQPDWPSNTVVTGYPFYVSQGSQAALSPELSAFLDNGPDPIVFTLGSSAVLDAGCFYRESAEAARRIGRRSVLLVGTDARNRPKQPLHQDSIAVEYAAYSQLFPRASAIVHQGGIGTTSEAMRAGRPMLVVPFGFDQPDNAERVSKLGIAKMITRSRYTADRAVEALKTLLEDSAYRVKAQQVGARFQEETGVVTACDEIERLIGEK